jgi:hypothetical protein
MRTDRRTDIPTLIVAFRNYAKALKNSIRVPSEPENYDPTRSSFSSVSVTVNFLFS